MGGAFGQYLKSAFHCFNEIKVEGLKREFSRFDFGKVENIIDNSQETLPTGPDEVEDFALLRVQAGIQ